MGNLFDNFKKNKPKHFEPTAQMLFDYEEHYMRLVKSYRHEIEFINDLPAIIKKLKSEPIADDVRRK